MTELRRMARHTALRAIHDRQDALSGKNWPVPHDYEERPLWGAVHVALAFLAVAALAAFLFGFVWPIAQAAVLR